MKISVIIPVYNSEKYLAECLDSVLAQTHRELEIILINDGSTDSSPAICDAYAERDSRVRVIHCPNGGVSHARNTGLEAATGELISFIDSDDTMESDMYELLVNAMLECDAQIAHCGYRHIVGDEVRVIHGTERVIVQDRDEALDCLVTGRIFGGGLWNKLFTTELAKGLRFREDLRINEDVLYNFEAFSAASVSVFCDYTKYNYIARFGESAVFNTPDEKKAYDSCEVSRIMYKSLCDGPLHDAVSERYVRALSGYYKFCAEHSPEKCRAIAQTMMSVADRSDGLGRNMRLTVALIKHCPIMYRIIYKLYASVRRPHFEPKKD